MIRLLLALAMLFTLTLIPVTSAEADSGGLRIGDKVVLDNGVVSEYLGENADGTRNWRATIGAPQYLDDLVTPIDCSWDYNAQKNEFTAEANLYTATVKDTKVSVAYKKKHMSWNPDVYVDGKKQTPIFDSPFILINDPINENYFGNTLYWEYPNITRNLRIIEGMLIEYYTIASLPDGDITIKTNVNRDADFIWARPSEAWDAECQPLALQQVKDKEVVLTLEAMQDAVFPITIDPDTAFTTSSSDGRLYESGANYATVRGAAVADSISVSDVHAGIGQQKSGATYYIFRGFVYFDTSALDDDCIVTASTLELYGSYDYSSVDFNVTIQIGSGTPPAYPHDPLVTSDYLHTYYSGDGGNLTTVGGWDTSGYNNITLDADGRDWINKTGDTKFALRSSLDIGDSAPAGLEYVGFNTFEKGAGYRPTLEVTYRAPAAPTIASVNASSVAKTTARLNSVLTDDGGGDVAVRWGYGNETQTAENFTSYDTVTNWEGEYSSGAHPYHDVSGLTANMTYYFRVEGSNTAGNTTAANELSFTTALAVSDPTDFRGYPQSTSISLAWAKGDGSTQSLIRFDYDDYPATTVNGTQVYLGTSASYTHSGLTVGTTYYYSVWGESGGGYSAGYDEVMVTTSAAETAAEGLPTPTTPSRWLAAPDYTNLENLLVLYPAVNSVADYLEMPRETLWMMLALLGAVALGIAIYMVSGGKMLLGMIALILALIFGWAIKIVPFWIPLMTLILVVGIKVSHRETQY